MEIVAFDTDDRADGSGKAKITWISKDCLKTKMQFNGTSWTDRGNCSVGGWEQSDLRSWLKTSVKTQIPSVVANQIVSVSKVQSNVTEEDSVVTFVKDGQTTVDDVWIPSCHEMYSEDSVKQNYFETTGISYSSRFNSDASRIKSCNGANADYLTRSVGNPANNSNHKLYMGSVSNSGSYYSNLTYSKTGVVLGFCT